MAFPVLAAVVVVMAAVVVVLVVVVAASSGVSLKKALASTIYFEASCSPEKVVSKVGSSKNFVSE